MTIGKFKVQKRWLVLAALLLGCLLGIRAILDSGWMNRYAMEQTIAAVESATGGKLNMSSLEVFPTSGRVVAQGIVFHGMEAPGETPLFTAKRLEVGLHIWTLLQQKLDLRLVDVEEPKIHLIWNADGTNNLPKRALARAAKSPLETFLDLKLGRFEARRGEIRINDITHPWSVHAQEVQARMDYLAVSRSYRTHLEAGKITYFAGSETNYSASTKLDLSLMGNRLEVERLELDAGEGTKLLAKGRVDRFDNPRADLTVDAQVAVGLLQSALKLPLEKRGTAFFKGGLLYDADRGIELHGDARAEQLYYLDETTRIGPLLVSGYVDEVPSSITVTKLRAEGLGGILRGGFGWKQKDGWKFDGDLVGLRLEGVLAQLQVKADGWTGSIGGPVRASGGKNPLDLETDLKLAGQSGGQNGSLPLEGLLALHYGGTGGILELRNSFLKLPNSRLNFGGSIREGLRVQATTSDLRDLAPIWKLAGLQQDLSTLQLREGFLSVSGTVQGTLDKPLFRGKFEATRLAWQGHLLDRAVGSVDLGEELLSLNGIEVDREGGRLRGDARAALDEGRLSEQSLLNGAFRLSLPEVAGLAKEFAWAQPAGSQGAGGQGLRGTVGVTLSLGGTIASPLLEGALRSPKLSWDEESIEQLNVPFQASKRDLKAPEWEARLGGRAIQGSLLLHAGSDDWKMGDGSVAMKVDSLPLGAIQRIKELGTRSTATLTTDLQAGLIWSPEGLSFSKLAGRLLLGNITQYGRPLGQLEFTVRTLGKRASLTAQGTLRQLPVKGDATIQLGPKLETELRLQLPKLDFPVIAQMFSEETLPSPLPYEGSAEASIYFQGPLLDPKLWNGTLTIPQLQLSPNKAYVNDTLPSVADVVLRNEGPVVLTFKQGQISATNTKLVAKNTNLTASFSYGLSDGKLSGRALGTINLAILSTLKPDLLATGSATLDTTLRGTVREPDLNGKLEFKDASFYLRDVLTGFEKVNGTMLFDRNRATIDSFRAQAGGGQLQLSGFVGFGKTLSYRLQAQTTQVRIRYPEGVSTLANSQLALTGTTAQSILTGSVTILRTNIGQIDTATLLSTSSAGAEAVPVRNEFLRNLQFDVRVESAPNAEFSTTLTKGVRGEIALRLRGSPQRPVLLGRVAATQGEIDFFGARYEISRAEVLFNNPLRIDPSVNLDLETRVRGVTITMNFSGPANKLNLTYRSDPPLQSSEILALLTVGRNPGSTSSVLPGGLSQSGGQTQGIGGNDSSVVVGAAVSAGINGRLQRFFGISRVRLDPQLTGIDNVPQARLTLEQQVSRDVTLTYITNLNRTQQQIVRVDWDISRQWSVVAIRDENGTFGLDLFFRKRYK